MADRKVSRRGGATQIDDLPSCLMIDILSRVPIETLAISRFVCKSWFLLFSDPEFVRLHSARSPARFLRWLSELKKNLKCYKSVGAMVVKDFEMKVRVPGSEFACANSCHGLLCLSRGHSKDEIYVCNPILGEYITIPTVRRGSSARIKSVLGFSSRSNQFKVLRIDYFQESGYMAEVYTIGNSTRQWKSIGIAPSCGFVESDDSVLNGSIHWADEGTRQIVYFDFESEQFRSLPSPPALCTGRWSSLKKVILRVCVVDRCLCISALGYDCYHNWSPVEKWVMKEYGVEESWTRIFSTQNNSDLTYKPSLISLQDFAGSENLTVLSRTRSEDQDSPEDLSNHIFQLWE